MENNISQKIIAFATILALPFALGAFVLAWAPAQQFYLSDPTYDGFVQPRSIANLVNITQDSTVTVYCDYGVGKYQYTQGTAFAVELEHSKDKKYQTTLLTNHHVIKKCLDDNKKIYVLALKGEEIEAVIDRTDKENDLAVLVTTLDIEYLNFSNYKPRPGYWIAAVGSADGYEGSVAFGNVLNMDKYELLITAPLSSGNSGGPLIDNEGNVVGINTKSPIGSDYQYNIAMSLDALCLKIMKCEDDVFWKVEE
jgi:S1-C subfamily serine protease